MPRGRKIERILSAAGRVVTFSKRRPSLFKKANELITLCGVETVVVVLSPAGKVYAFGHPSVNAIIHRYDPSQLEDSEAANVRNCDDLNLQFQDLLGEVEMQQKRRVELNRSLQAELSQLGSTKWLIADIDVLKPHELQQRRDFYRDLKVKLAMKIQDFMLNPCKFAAALNINDGAGPSGTKMDEGTSDGPNM